MTSIIFNSSRSSHYYSYIDIIEIDVSEIITFAHKSGIPFSQAFSEVVSHEVLHSVLFNLFDSNTSLMLDNICSKKIYTQCNIKGINYDETFDSSFKHWHGGLYEGK